MKSNPVPTQHLQFAVKSYYQKSKNHRQTFSLSRFSSPPQHYRSSAAIHSEKAPALVLNNARVSVAGFAGCARIYIRKRDTSQLSRGSQGFPFPSSAPQPVTRSLELSLALCAIYTPEHTDTHLRAKIFALGAARGHSISPAPISLECVRSLARYRFRATAYRGIYVYVCRAAYASPQ